LAPIHPPPLWSPGPSNILFPCFVIQSQFNLQTKALRIYKF
jgi:hypothetical protein